MIHRIKCGHCGGQHMTVDLVRHCRNLEIEMLEEVYADNAYVRMMENTGIGMEPCDLFDGYGIW